jgi:hypothetical protein
MLILWFCLKKISWWVELKEVRARRQACVREERSTLDHILTLRTLFEQEVSIGRCLYPCLLISRKTFVFFGTNWKFNCKRTQDFKKNFWHSPTWQAWGTPPTIRCTTSFTTCCKSHVHHNLHKSSNKLATHMVK